ncbi:MAG: hypothetical protein U9N49_01640 [Campylobacterota bacterium]|nr:hypothetical protein [Campylobacterota bacterium]
MQTDTKKLCPMCGILLYLTEVFFEVVVFAIGYFTLKIITLWRYPKSFAGAMRFDTLIYLVAFIDMILVVYLIA